MVVEGAIVLLMFFGSPMELKEYTLRDGLSECLKQNVQLNVMSKSKTHELKTEYTGTMRLACQKFDVELR